MNETTWKPSSLNEATRFSASAYWPFQPPYETPSTAGFAGAVAFAVVSFTSVRASTGRATMSAPSNAAAAASRPRDIRRPSGTWLALADERDVVDPEVVVGARRLRLEVDREQPLRIDVRLARRPPIRLLAQGAERQHDALPLICQRDLRAVIVVASGADLTIGIGVAVGHLHGQLGRAGRRLGPERHALVHRCVVGFFRIAEVQAHGGVDDRLAGELAFELGGELGVVAALDERERAALLSLLGPH